MTDWLRTRPGRARALLLLPLVAAGVALLWAVLPRPALLVAASGGLLVGLVRPFVAPRLRRLQPNPYRPVDRAAINEAVLTGRPTGDLYLDTQVRAVLAGEALRERQAAGLAGPGLIALTLLPVVAAVVVSPWWLAAELGWLAPALSPARTPSADRSESAAERLARFDGADTAGPA